MFFDEFKGHLRSLSLFAQIFSSYGFDLYINVMLLYNLLLFMQVVCNLNILTCIVNQNIWLIFFAMTLKVISRPFNIELLRLFHA